MMQFDLALTLIKQRLLLPGNTGEIVIPNELSLDKYKITCAGERSKIGSLCKDVTYLDLSDNLISDWSEVC